MQKILAVLLVVVLSACGGGEPEAQSEGAPPAASLAQDKEWVGVAFGDSTQMGQATSAPAEAQKIFDRNGEPFRLINRGTGNLYAQQLLLGTGDEVAVVPFEDLPDVVGAHFVMLRFGLTDPRHYSPDMFFKYMRRLVDITEAREQIAIIETPSPIVKEGRTERMALNVEKLRQLAAIRPNAVLCDHNAYGYEHGFENTIDGYHSTPYAYEKWQGPLLATCVRAAKRKWREVRQAARASGS